MIPYLRIREDGSFVSESIESAKRGFEQLHIQWTHINQ